MGVAQAREIRSAEPHPKRQFDFWLGEWDLAWGDGDSGTNSVYLDFGGAVVVENFDGRPSTEFQGMSLSVYDEQAREWRQTWVDSEAAFLTFAGEFVDGEMDLRREAPDGLYRMVWFDIERDSFAWRYERSTDGGESWESLWEIGYSRVV
jgi:hypothetical protein